MTWQLINVEPQYGICDSCHRHDCGIVDGQHKWIVTGIEDKYGDRQVIGYDCVKMWADNMGITREVVTRVVTRPPTEEELRSYILNHLMSGTAIPISEDVTMDDTNSDNDVDQHHSDIDTRSDVASVGQQTGDSTPPQQGTGKRANNAHRSAVRKPRNVRKSQA